MTANRYSILKTASVVAEHERFRPVAESLAEVLGGMRHR